jgi:hypothetical protein
MRGLRNGLHLGHHRLLVFQSQSHPTLLAVGPASKH